MYNGDVAAKCSYPFPRGFLGERVRKNKMSTVENTPDTWGNRIETAAKIMGLDPRKVEEILDSPGFEITRSEFRLEMISDEEITPFGDIRKLFCEEKAQIPVPKLRMAMKYLRGPSTSAKTDKLDPDIVALKQEYGITTKMEDLDVLALLKYYSPLKVNNIHEILKKRYQAKYGAFIAFKPNTKEVAVEETVNYITDLETGYPNATHVEVDGEPVRLCNVGQIPNQLVDEDPLFVGSPLKRERSINNYLNWVGITHEVRAFFRVLLTRGEVNVNNKVETAQLIRKTISELKELFPEAYVQWSELKQRDELPKLHLTLNDVEKTRTQNPFGVNRRF